MYDMSQWHAVELDVGYLRTRQGDSVPDMKWNLLVKPGATVDRVTYQVMAALKSITNKVIPAAFNLAVFAIEDNRSAISEK